MITPRRHSDRYRAAIGLWLICVLTLSLSGCSRRFWRLQAEQDSYHAITEKLNDERWKLPRISLTPDERSRFYDPHDPDCQPLPPDDPAAHQFMHCANGKEGYKGWHDLGDTLSVENPNWLEPFSGLLNCPDPTKDHENVEIPKVTLQDSVELTYIHSREYQTQVEEVYLKALALTGDRYILGTRFNLAGAGRGGAFFDAAHFTDGTDVRGLANGIAFQQLLTSGAQIGLDFTNIITWSTGSDSSTAAALGWGITQPLLNAAGRKLVMESLTQSERNLLYEIRNLARFRQTLFTDVASDYLRLQQQAQNIRNAENNIRQLKVEIEAGKVADSWEVDMVGGDLKALPDGFVIPESLSNKLRFQVDRLTWSGSMTDEQKQELLALSADESYQTAVQELIGWREIQVGTLGVLQLVTRLNNAQNALEGNRRERADTLDRFKIRLGLPPNVDMTVDETFLAPFELINTDLLTLADELKEFAKVQGPSVILAPRGAGAAERLPPALSDLKNYVAGLAKLRGKVAVVGLQQVKDDFVPLRSLLQSTVGDNLRNADGRGFRNPEERNRVIRDVARDLRNYRLSELDFQRWSRAIDMFESLMEYEDEAALIASIDTNQDGMIQESELPTGWNDVPQIPSTRPVPVISGSEFVVAVRDAAITMQEELLQIAQSLTVVQAGLRVEAIALNEFTLPGHEQMPDIDEVVRVGLENRLDLMNARATVMDARRDMEVKANALKAKMDLKVEGVAGFTGNLSDDVNVSLDFKTPIDHVLERNAYSESLVTYQRARRTYMALEDAIKQAIRADWRQIRVSQLRLEIDRQTVRSAALEFDNVSIAGGQNNSLSLLNALDNILDAQNALVGDWITYETNRLNIFRDMGIMELGETGVWQDKFYLPDSQPPPEIPPASTVLTPEQQSNIPPEQLPQNGQGNNPNAGTAPPALEIPENE